LLYVSEESSSEGFFKWPGIEKLHWGWTCCGRILWTCSVLRGMLWYGADEKRSTVLCFWELQVAQT